MARVVFVNVGFPHQLDYPEARPIKLALQQGHEVHAVSLRGDHPGFEGVVHWRERTLLAMAWRVRRLNGDLTFFERPGRLLLSAAASPTPWVRAPERVESLFKRRLQDLAMRRVTLVSFTNPHEAGRWRIPPDRLRDLPYPTELDVWSRLPMAESSFWESRGLPVPQRVMACLANLMYRKQQLELVAWAAPMLLEDPGLVLALAGREYDQGIGDEIRAAAGALGVSDQVHLLGHLGRPDIQQLLAWTSVHVVNSNNETQCMALYEGLAAGVATTVFDYGVLTSAFPFLPRHRDGESFRRNARVLMDAPRAGDEQRLLAMPRLAWADVGRHDEVFLDVLASLGGRGLA